MWSDFDEYTEELSDVAAANIVFGIILGIMFVGIIIACVLI